jgi:hypothetical protein
MSMPTPNTNPPPSITLAIADNGGVSMKRHCTQAIAASSIAATPPATIVAMRKWGMR